MSKNNRWALALIGVVILIVAAVVIGTNDDSNTATETDEPSAPAQQATGSTSAPSTGGTESTERPGGEDETGGTTPDDGDGGGSPGDDTGGTSPQNNGSGTGGAEAGTSRSTAPLLRSGKKTTIKVDKGETVYIRGRSATTDELHIHGYDLYVPLPAGKTVNYKFKADIDGVFEIELHGNGEQVADLRVSP
ncbi:MAG: hypothetical protein ACPGWS_06540 [Solirubrobacterales bacterium]